MEPIPMNPPPEHDLVIGFPSSESFHYAQDRGMGLIVMGTHGGGGLSRLLMGSVAEATVRHASCPVLTFESQPPSTTAHENRWLIFVIWANQSSRVDQFCIGYNVPHSRSSDIVTHPCCFAVSHDLGWAIKTPELIA
jgi:hypothetical protein